MRSTVHTHEFNSTWWGAPVGIVRDPTFFSLSATARAEALRPFHWVEFKAPLDDPTLDFCRMATAGFFLADCQVNYRLRLPCSQAPASLARLDLEFADDAPFTLEREEMAPFIHERYFRLPGVTEARVTERYAIWSRNQLSETPGCCLRILHDGQVQGWYLADDRQGNGLQLTLAMLSAEASISGLLLFLKAYEGFAARGHRLGWAAFSIQNTPVHNIYASIGARFLKPTGCWFWINGDV